VITARVVRALLAGVGLGTIGSAAIYSAAKISQPVALLYGQRTELAGLDARAGDLASEEQRLQARLRYFSSEDGRTQRMHELGQLLPGERFVRLLPAERQSEAAAKKAQPEATDRVRAAGKRLGKRVRDAILPGPPPG